MSLTITSGIEALVGETFELAHDPHAAQGSIDHTSQAFTAEVIDDAEDPQAPAVTQRVGNKIETPALVNPLGQ